MEKIISKYLLAFDELNALLAFRFKDTAEDDTEKRILDITEDLLSFLILAYTDGIQAISEMLGADIEVNISEMQNAIYRKISGEDFTDRVRKHVSDNHEDALLNMAESEYHRVFNTAMSDGAHQTGLSITKKWHTVGDEKVRETHAYLENMEIGIDEKFYTFDGDSALFPGDFSKAENNANCRCILLYYIRQERR